jgi:single-strand DNA-binding protein
MNVVILRGALSRPCELRQLRSGEHVAAYEVTIRHEEGPADTVPVVWHGAPASACGLDVGEDVVVTGRVRRRFFRAGGTTQSRTEVVADAVLPTRRRKRVAEVIDAALALVEAAEPAGAG